MILPKTQGNSPDIFINCLTLVFIWERGVVAAQKITYEYGGSELTSKYRSLRAAAFWSTLPPKYLSVQNARRLLVRYRDALTTCRELTGTRQNKTPQQCIEDPKFSLQTESRVAAQMIESDGVSRIIPGWSNVRREITRAETGSESKSSAGQPNMALPELS